MQWLALLRQLDLAYDGHTLVSRGEVSPESDSENGDKPDVARHRTAIKRYDLSKPVKQLLERGLLRKNETFFDYGCGHGMDIEALQSLGYEAAGWNPAFGPAAQKTSAAVVNLGYVLNVIEEPAERIAAIREAYALAARILIVSTLASGQETDAHSRPYRDVFLRRPKRFRSFTDREN